MTDPRLFICDMDGTLADGVDPIVSAKRTARMMEQI